MAGRDPDISPVPLRQDMLDRLPPEIERPGYDRARLTPGIVHIGLGNFHRAHQAWYLHRLMQTGRALDWAIIGASVRHHDADMRAALLKQDCLTTLIELDPAGTRAEVTGAMIGYLPIEAENAALIRQMSRPEIRIVSLTVTEGGYFLDAATGALDIRHPELQHDAAHPDRPRTAFGAIVAALAQRRSSGAGPFTLLSCDNIRGNGEVLRQIVVGLAALTDPVLATWIDTACTFPNSMVDCIVPATGQSEIAAARALGIVDAAPVTHENFRQWVVQDRFCAGRPAWEDVGVTFARDVHAYEAMKIRILNAGHQVLANIGEILNVPTIADCMQDPQIRAFFRKVQEREILPYVAPVPDTTPSAYLDLIETRFANPEIRDTTRRVAFDGSSRHTGFVLPILADALSAQAPVAGLALVEAFWCRMCLGLREDGSVIEANDPHWQALQQTAKAACDDPAVWIDQEQFYGALASDPAFRAAFIDARARISSAGCRAAMAHYLTQTP